MHQISLIVSNQQQNSPHDDACCADRKSSCAMAAAIDKCSRLVCLCCSAYYLCVFARYPLNLIFVFGFFLKKDDAAEFVFLMARYKSKNFNLDCDRKARPQISSDRGTRLRYEFHRTMKRTSTTTIMLIALRVALDNIRRGFRLEIDHMLLRLIRSTPAGPTAK